MTIKQIEELSGMTRANIRFYEQEGLITPLRGSNDYRDYSDDDLAALLKIKLLRQLQVPLEDIGKLQSGELELSAALEDKIKQLESDIADRKNAAEICRDIKANDITYPDLDAKKYLSWISAVSPSDSDYFTIQTDAQKKVRHPWRRFFARGLDLTVYGVLWSAISYLWIHMNPNVNQFERLILSLIPFGMMLLIEPILLSTLGTTPGKWIFGLHIRGFGGRKLSLSEAWNRTGLLFVYGEGFCIPFYSLYRQYKSYITCRDNGELLWDEDVSYSIRDTKNWRIAAYIMANALLMAITVFIVLQASMPHHRGDVSAEAFTQNFNDLMDFSGFKNGMHLNAQGKWTEDPQAGTTFYLQIGPPPPDFEITEENGIVTKVFFEISSDTPNVIRDDFTNQIICAVNAYVCAQREINLINRLSVLSPNNTAFTNFEWTKAGITVNCHFEYEGYEFIPSYALLPIDYEKQYFHLEFSMEKTA